MFDGSVDIQRCPRAFFCAQREQPEAERQATRMGRGGAMAIVNLTPHALLLRKEDGSVLEVPPSGTVARRREERRVVGQVEGLSVHETVYGPVEGLPEKQDGVIYIVSALLAAGAPQRDDVFAPGPALRDEQGRVTGAVGLSRIR